MLLPLPLECWDCRFVSLCAIYVVLETWAFVDADVHSSKQGWNLEAGEDVGEYCFFWLAQPAFL